MATRNFVPRADGEGKLGTPSKKWGDVYATTIHGSLDGNASSATLATNATNDADGNPISSIYVKKDSDYLGYRQPSTAYTTGAMANHVTLPAGWFLECTTAGTTGSGMLTITTPTVGGTVSDGTVTWTVRQVASTKNLEGFVNDGMHASTTSIRRNTPGSYMQIVSGTDISTCPYLELKGPLNTNISEGQRGGFSLVAQNSENARGLSGYVDGTLTWNGNSLDKSAVVAESLGENGYRKYASGLIEQWGIVEFSAVPTGSGAHKNVTLPISYTTIKNVVCSVADVQHGMHGYCLSNPSDSVTYITIQVYNTNNATQDMKVNWQAIGY